MPPATVRRVEDHRVVAHEREVVRAGEARRPGADDRDPPAALDAGTRPLDDLRDLLERAAALDAVPFVDHALERPDVDRARRARPRRQAASQGCAQTRPQTDANGLGPRASAYASSKRPCATSAT